MQVPLTLSADGPASRTNQIMADVYALYRVATLITLMSYLIRVLVTSQIKIFVYCSDCSKAVLKCFGIDSRSVFEHYGIHS